tara:strand:- start:23339 stop:24505 length:1167 start_codon:yes stop_codon:yes gene_type:complete
MAQSKESCTIRPELIEFDKQNNQFMTIVSHTDGFKLVQTTEPTNTISDMSTFDNINLADLYLNNLNLSGNIYVNGDLVTDPNVTGTSRAEVSEIYQSDNAFKTLVVHDKITMYDHDGSNVCSIMALKGEDQMSILPIIEPDYDGSVTVQFTSTITISEVNEIKESLTIDKQELPNYYNNNPHYYFTIAVGSTVTFVVPANHQLYNSDVDSENGTIVANYINKSLREITFNTFGVYGFNCFSNHTTMLLVIRVVPKDGDRINFTTLELNGVTIKEEMHKSVLFVDDIMAQTVTTGSDQRIKKNIEPLTNGISMIDQMNPVTYNWIHDDICENPEYGFIAQEVEEHFPSLVRTDVESGMKSVDYMKITSILAAAVQELSQEIHALKEKLA